MALVRFELDLTPGGGRVVVDGVDVSDRVAGVRVDAGVDQIPHVLLELAGEGTIEGVGVVETASTFDPAGVVAFLEALDPESVEKAAGDGLGWGEGNYTVALLDYLKRLARGTA